MALTPEDVAFLAAWAREEREPNCWSGPAHRFQAFHKVSGVVLLRLIKGWAHIEGRRDEDIYSLASSETVAWPWSSAAAVEGRLIEIQNNAMV